MLILRFPKRKSKEKGMNEDKFPIPECSPRSSLAEVVDLSTLKLNTLQHSQDSLDISEGPAHINDDSSAVSSAVSSPSINSTPTRKSCHTLSKEELELKNLFRQKLNQLIMMERINSNQQHLPYLKHYLQDNEDTEEDQHNIFFQVSFLDDDTINNTVSSNLTKEEKDEMAFGCCRQGLRQKNDFSASNNRVCNAEENLDPNNILGSSCPGLDCHDTIMELFTYLTNQPDTKNSSNKSHDHSNNFTFKNNIQSNENINHMEERDLYNPFTQQPRCISYSGTLSTKEDYKFSHNTSSFTNMSKLQHQQNNICLSFDHSSPSGIPMANQINNNNFHEDEHTFDDYEECHTFDEDASFDDAYDMVVEHARKTGKTIEELLDDMTILSGEGTLNLQFEV